MPKGAGLVGIWPVSCDRGSAQGPSSREGARRADSAASWTPRATPRRGSAVRRCRTSGASDRGAPALESAKAEGAEVTLAYATADGTVVASEDYAAMSGTLSFGAGEREKTVAMPIRSTTARTRAGRSGRRSCWAIRALRSASTRPARGRQRHRARARAHAYGRDPVVMLRVRQTSRLAGPSDRCQRRSGFFV